MSMTDRVESLWKGYRRVDFTCNGDRGLVVFPHQAKQGNPWVWRAEFFDVFAYADMALLEQGWAIGALSISDMFGCPQAVEKMKGFHDELVTEFDLFPKADLFGFSRGGLYSVNYTAKYPQDVSTLYLDAPVLDIFSWPGGKGKGIGSPNDWKMCMDWYGLSEQTCETFSDRALDKIPVLLKHHIPVMLVAGDQDEVVPYEENGAYLEKQYREKDGNLKCIIKKGVGHHPHSLEDPHEITEFIKHNFEMNLKA